jgi:uncharacterized protein involved in response to NO
MALLNIDDPAAAAHAGSYQGPAVLALGFRPFYLLAAAWAALAIPLWLGSYFGWISLPAASMAWHMHEMVFGFVVAVVIGFLYTAGRNWTGLWTPRGPYLAAIALLWLAGRVAMLSTTSAWGAAIDAAFLPLATWPLYRVIARSDNKRNVVMVVILALLILANLLFHAAQLGFLPIASARPMYGALIMIVIIESVMGGRVIPNFTANAVPGVKAVPRPRLDRNCMILTILAGLAWVVQLPALFSVPLALAAAGAQAWRLAEWQPLSTLRQPLLWILHVSYAWIPVGFVLLALAQAGLAPLSAAVHLLAVGGMGGLIVGMITRTALGHTGRPLKAGRRDTAMYVLVQLGVLARLGVAFVPAALHDSLLLLAGAFWSATFLLYLITYAPRLWAARLDGREG